MLRSIGRIAGALCLLAISTSASWSRPVPPSPDCIPIDIKHVRDLPPGAVRTTDPATGQVSYWSCEPELTHFFGGGAGVARVSGRYGLTRYGYFITSLGGSHTSTGFKNTGTASAGVDDLVTDNSAKPSSNDLVGGVGFSIPAFTFPAMPTQASPLDQAPSWIAGFDGEFYFFTGAKGTINGIPGGPFGTATGSDSFNIRNNYMLTAGGFVATPIMSLGTVALTGGFAVLNQTVRYNCAMFCAVAPATPAFSASQDQFVGGGYIGVRLTRPVALPGLPDANISLDYKHMFFSNYDVSLGAVATRQVNANLSPDMDLVTVRLAVPIH